VGRCACAVPAAAPASVSLPAVAGRIGHRVAQSAQGRTLAAPAGRDLDPQVEVDPRVEKRLDLLARAPAELPDRRTAAADQDRLLAVPLHVDRGADVDRLLRLAELDRKSTRLNSSHVKISYAVFCL